MTGAFLRGAVSVLALAWWAGCTPRGDSPDAGAAADAGPVHADAGAADAGWRLDAGVPDTGGADAAQSGVDAAVPDAAPEPPDAAVPDAALEPPDAAVPDAAPEPPDASAPDATSPPTTLTVVTLNTHSFQEGADSLDKLGAIGRGLAALQADLVGLNEVMSGDFWAYGMGGAHHDGTLIIQQALEEASGVGWHAATFGFAHWESGELMSNVLLSRTPILESDGRALTTTDFWPGPGEQRNVGYIRTAVPGLGLVNVFVTHPWGWSGVDGPAQVAEVKAFMVEKFRGDEALDLLVGDLNCPSTWALYNTWVQGPPFRLMDTYALANPLGTADPTEMNGTHRIDYVLAGEGWPLAEDPAHFRSFLAFDGLEHGGVSLPVVSDHRGVVTVFTTGSW